MNKKAPVILKIVFAIDAVIAIGFGIYSWLFPQSTFGTIISIPEAHASVFLSILSGLSLFYILTGLTCLIGIKSSFPMNIWMGMVMLVRHLLEGVLKIGDIGKDWLIGNPYPDIIIHSVFVFVYILALSLNYRYNRTSKKVFITTNR